MGFTQDKKNKIIKYLLEKIMLKDRDYVSKTTKAFYISFNTVYRYLRELEKEKIINKTNNSDVKYSLVMKNQHYIYDLANTKLEEDIVYSQDIKKHLISLPINVQRIWEYSFSEMFNNVIDHSEAKNVICLINQNYLITVIMIADTGIGIFEKIRSYYNFNTLDDAITELFKGKLTTDTSRHSGEGIFFTSRALDYFAAVSCDKVFTHDKVKDELFEIEKNPLFSRFKSQEGTNIFMILSNYSNKQLKEVFDMFSDVDGGFTKTMIPINKVFDHGFPVSRSQAKRLCNRFENFNEIILDFAGVTEIGQGFAHELFVVFQNSYPDIQFNTINANDDVKKMINHVKLTIIR